MTSNKSTVKCSFCKKAAAEVKCMLSEPPSFICNECVTLCQDILDERKQKADPASLTTQESARLDIIKLKVLLNDAQRLLTREVQDRRRRTNPMEDIIEKIEAVLRPTQHKSSKEVTDIIPIKTQPE